MSLHAVSCILDSFTSVLLDLDKSGISGIRWRHRLNTTVIKISLIAMSCCILIIALSDTRNNMTTPVRLIGLIYTCHSVSSFPGWAPIFQTGQNTGLGTRLVTVVFTCVTGENWSVSSLARNRRAFCLRPPFRPSSFHVILKQGTLCKYRKSVSQT